MSWRKTFDSELYLDGCGLLQNDSTPIYTHPVVTLSTYGRSGSDLFETLIMPMFCCNVSENRHYLVGIPHHSVRLKTS